MIPALPLLSTVNGSPAVQVGAFRFRLPMDLAASAPRWRVGDRIMLIGGVQSAGL